MDYLESQFAGLDKTIYSLSELTEITPYSYDFLRRHANKFAVKRGNEWVTKISDFVNSMELIN